MITWILDKHVDRVRNAPTPFAEEAQRRGHIVYGLRDSIIPKAIDLTGIRPSGPTIVRGSHGFVSYVQRELNPSPGGFLHPERFKPSVYAPLIGHFALNSEFEIIEYKDFHLDNVFVKPLEEMKKFTGVVVKKDQTLEEACIQDKGKWFELEPSCKLIVSPCKAILKEYRIVVVDEKPITGSTYDSVAGVPEHVMATAYAVACLWNPMGAYVIDIAETDSENKVVEYNQFSTSAMYACDQAKIMDALEALFL
jgi:hypothetical protein